ncbi:hypothetical protein TSAR_003328, partial [Trichomalopsis sarcophagae]
SGVETGNDSNDSSVTQHDSTVPIIPAGTFGRAQPSSAAVNNLENGTSETEASVEVVTPPEATSQNELPGISDPLQSTPNNSLVSVSLFNTKPIFSLAFDLSFEKQMGFRVPPMYPPAALDHLNLKTTQSHLGRIKRCAFRSQKKRSYIEFDELKSQVKERKMRLAAATNNTDMMRILLESGVSPNNCDDQGRSPLHLASCRGYTEMVSLLLKYGANPNQRDSIGNTPLHLAAVTSKISVVTLLLMAGTDVLSSDCHGYNPLQLAQTKLRVLQNCKGSDMSCIKDEVRNVIGMLLAYLQKQKDAREQVEALSTFCSRLSLSNDSDQIQDDVRSLLANIDSLSLTN